MIIGNYKIESDPLNVTLSEKKLIAKDTEKSKAGDEYWSVIGYYATTEEALRAMANYRIKKSGLKDRESLRKLLKEIHEEIQTAKQLQSSDT